MPATRRRRTVRRAVIGVVVVVLLLMVYSTTREPTEIRRSRMITLGMTASEVEGVMGAPDYICSRSNDGSGMYFGRSLVTKLQVLGWLGLEPAFEFEDFPVRVRLDTDGRVVGIERANVVEESPDNVIDPESLAHPSPDPPARQTNQQIAEAVKDALTAAKLEGGKHIDIEVLSGVCTLEGYIGDAEQRIAVERIVNGVGGVNSVNNKLVLTAKEDKTPVSSSWTSQ